MPFRLVLIPPVILNPPFFILSFHYLLSFNSALYLSSFFFFLSSFFFLLFHISCLTLFPSIQLFLHSPSPLFLHTLIPYVSLAFNFSHILHTSILTLSFLLLPSSPPLSQLSLPSLIHPIISY